VDAPNAVERPLLLATLARWWRLLPVLWPPILIGYLAGGATIALRSQSADGLRTVLMLGSSWLGQAWAAAACEDERPSIGSILGRLRVAGWRLWGGAVMRAGIVYGPALLLFAVGALRVGVEQEVGQANPVPMLALVLLPLSLILASLFAPLPSVLVVDRPAGVMAALNRAKQLGDPMLAGALGWGGMLVVAIALTSALPTDPPQILPNHAIGSLVWVLLAVGSQRARAAVDS